jgi:hypothetical protein
MAKPKTYGDAMAQARAVLNRTRLDDPDEHFPYKRDAVRQLLDEDPPMGPGVPGGQDGTQDRSRTVSDYITPDIADATADYIDAQAAYLADVSDENRQAYDAARDRLQAARLDHRQNRGQGFTIGAAAGRAG